MKIPKNGKHEEKEIIYTREFETKYRVDKKKFSYKKLFFSIAIVIISIASIIGLAIGISAAKKNGGL